VNHSADEYARFGGFVHVNNAENYFSIFKHGLTGTFHHISEQHLHRYLAEFAAHVQLHARPNSRLGQVSQVLDQVGTANAT
jgi:hypothetical protein